MIKERRKFKHKPADYDKILSLWKGREGSCLHFNLIDKEMKELGWYQNKTIRRLSEMITLRLLTKEKEGAKGARSQYKPTDKTHEYEVHSFFNSIRQASQEKDLIINEESLLIFGIPKRSELSPLEEEILNLVIGRISDAVGILQLLRSSRMSEGEDNRLKNKKWLVREYLYEQIKDLTFGQWWDVHREECYPETAILAHFAKDLGLEIGSDETLEIEETLNAPRVFREPFDAIRSFDESLLAVLAMPSPEGIVEYALDPYNFLKAEIIDNQKQKPVLSDADLVRIARNFVYETSMSKRANLVRERKLALSKWPWLTLNIGKETAERLEKIIYFAWQNDLVVPASALTEEEMAQNPNLTVGDLGTFKKEERERRLEEEIEKILEGSKKIIIEKK